MKPFLLAQVVHYYKRNIGDYAKKAGKLSMLQHGAYTLLIDACYDRERFPTLEDAMEWAWAESEAEQQAVQVVLRRFFTLKDGLYMQDRITEELAAYKDLSEVNSRIAKQREETKRARSVLKREPVVHESAPNHEPLTTNQEPRTREKTARGSRLPQDFQVDMQFAVDQGIPNCLEESARFRDYWNAQPGQRGVKLDWQATWRNWCRSAKKPVPQQMQKTFAERDREAGWARWEEQTGKIHPDRQKAQGHVIDITPRNLEIEQ